MRNKPDDADSARLQHTPEYPNPSGFENTNTAQDEHAIIAPSSCDHPLYPLIVKACQTVYDPEIPVNVYDLGLIYTIEIDNQGAVRIIMTLTAPGCPVAGEMPGWVAEAVQPLDGVKHVDVELTWSPPWGMDMMSDAARLDLGFI